MRHNMIPFAGLLMALAAIPAASAAENFKLHGALVAEPCSLQSGDESIELNFGNIVDKYLYTNQRSHGKAFSLRLIDCDISLGKGVQISFSGAESLVLPGLLALAAGSQAQGVAIGFETSAGQPLPLHAWGMQEALVNGDNTIALQAYIQAEPNVSATKSIELGAFSAVATFSLRYE
ncbi:fimbrial protein [Serratia marcescens]|uniref:fimbrial protein n=1 Tax=Serratia marcescens TaxID=615 RepID=UPI003FA694D0